ncbi:MAG: bacteriohopanetetrol glucosamine biosynthesis glycosyltransferase HpnI [Bryobacteraceae bacterium]
MIHPPAWPALAAAAYWLVVLLAVWRHLARRRAYPSYAPPVSILKPIHGRDPQFYEAIRAHATQQYAGPFEILFGVRGAEEPALEDIARLSAEYPQAQIRVIWVTSNPANAKVGSLADLARAARYNTLLVSDSDIHVEPGYLRRVVAPLSDPQIGIVTCLYRARAQTRASLFEAIGIGTDFAAGVLVAPLVGVAEFALGSTMVFRRADLEAMGGFETLASYLADDYQLGAHISRLGRRVALSDVVVQTNLSGSWRDVWMHQLRWSRTIRVCRPMGYYGFAATQAVVWALLAALAGAWQTALITLGIRMIAGVAVGAGVLRDRNILRCFWLIPFRDLFGFAVWAAALGGNTVEWRGKKLRLFPDGTVKPLH